MTKRKTETSKQNPRARPPRRRPGGADRRRKARPAPEAERQGTRHTRARGAPAPALEPAQINRRRDMRRKANRKASAQPHTHTHARTRTHMHNGRAHMTHSTHGATPPDDHLLRRGVLTTRNERRGVGWPATPPRAPHAARPHAPRRPHRATMPPHVSRRRRPIPAPCRPVGRHEARACRRPLLSPPSPPRALTTGSRTRTAGPCASASSRPSD